jgi:hypothetical protein
MTSEEFIEAIRKGVHDVAIRGMLRGIAKPPGRKIEPREKARAEWYLSLDSVQRQFVDDVIAESVNAGIHAFLCVLDGIMNVDTDPYSRFEVRYISENETTVLNAPRQIKFTELWNAED